MKKNMVPFVLKAPTQEGISLVLTAVCTRCNQVVEMKVNPKKKGAPKPVAQVTELQCPRCKTVYRVPAITRRKGMTI